MTEEKTQKANAIL
jgi:hypothetical protein